MASGADRDALHNAQCTFPFNNNIYSVQLLLQLQLSWVHLIFKFICFHFEPMQKIIVVDKKKYMFGFSAFLWFSILHFLFWFFSFVMMRLRQKHMRLITRFVFFFHIFLCLYFFFGFFVVFFLVFAFCLRLLLDFCVNFLLWYFLRLFLCLILFTQDGVYFLHICIFCFHFLFLFIYFCFAH